MPSTWVGSDAMFPRFTGEESTEEKIESILSYLHILQENLQYMLRNIDFTNLNSKTTEYIENLKADSISADKITAGTLGADVIYSGEISADKITTGALSADAVTLDGLFSVYDSSGNYVGKIGGMTSGSTKYMYISGFGSASIGLVRFNVGYDVDVAGISADKIQLNGDIALQEDNGYGSSLPSSGEEGQLFFLI